MAFFISVAGVLQAVEFEYTQLIDGALSGTGECIAIPCDSVLMAIGQSICEQARQSELLLVSNRIQVDEQQRTSDQQIWAGGDCASNGDDLTVAAVQAGKVAAESIHHVLSN